MTNDNALSTFDRIAEAQGWNTDSQLSVMRGAVQTGSDLGVYALMVQQTENGPDDDDGLVLKCACGLATYGEPGHEGHTDYGNDDPDARTLADADDALHRD